MANRKVLINRHTTGSTAPVASTMYKGEIAVAHKTGEETIWTKNNDDVMVPFISCAQTMTMIDNAITAAAITYDVQAAQNDEHVDVVSGGTNSAKVFTVSSKDVQSEEEFEAYSAATKVRIDNNVSAITALTEAVSALTDIVVTAVSSGDEIILVDPSTTGANSYTFTHRTGDEASGFNKLATDAYGHVTAHTAVATADIQALGFKTSAETGEDLAELSASVVANETHISELSAGTQHDIEALSGDVVEYVKVVSGNIETVVNALSAGTIQVSADTEAAIIKLSGDTEAAITAAVEALDSSISASTGKYFTAIAIEDGKLAAKEEADLPTLSVESAGTGNVVSSIAVNDHKITYQTVSVATSEDVDKLSAATIALSAGTVHDLEELSGATQAISGYAHDEIAQLSGATKAISGYAHDEIAALSAGTIQLSADTKATIEQLSAGTIQLSADTVAYVNQLSGYAHGEIVELSGAVKTNETDIDNLSAATLDLSAVTLTGVSLNSTPLTVTDHVVSVPVTTSGSGIANATESGSVADALAVKEYVQNTVSSAVEYKGATDDVPAGTPVKGDLWIASSAFTIDGQHAEVGDFIIYDGEHWQVIEKNLDGAITGTLTQDTVTLGDSTNSVKSLANGASGQVLTMAGGAPAWVDDPELSVVSAGTGNVLTDITVNDHEITFTKGVTAASDAELKALSAGTIQLSADTKAAINALSAGTIQLSADTKAAIEQLSGFAHNSMIARDDAVFSSANTYADEKVAAEIALLDSSTAVTTGKYITGIAIADGKISGITEEFLPANVVLTATTATPVSTASAVLTGVTADGTDNHNLTFGMSNKVFSASSSDSAVTSQSAITSQSAQTSVSANMAYELSSAATISSGQVRDLENVIKSIKVNSATTAESADTAAKVANKLYMRDEPGNDDVEYDGSASVSVVFGTVGDSSLPSMSMSSVNGVDVVDVEVIDCGTY